MACFTADVLLTWKYHPVLDQVIKDARSDYMGFLCLYPLNYLVRVQSYQMVAYAGILCMLGFLLEILKKSKLCLSGLWCHRESLMAITSMPSDAILLFVNYVRLSL